MGRGLEGKEVEGAVLPEKPGTGGMTRLKEASGDHIRVWKGWGGNRNRLDLQKDS